MEFYNESHVRMLDKLGQDATYASDLNKVGKREVKGFQGVFSSDNTPKLQPNQSLIMNTQDSTKPGQHWCALYRYVANNKDLLLFFDSFGRNPKDLSPHWNEKFTNVVTSPQNRLQSYRTTDCGTKCLAFLLTVQKYGPFKLV